MRARARRGPAGPLTSGAMDVSVVIPTRDRASYLHVALASLAARSGTETLEVIVVDDASRDSTAAVCRRWGVRHLRRTDQIGLNAARNLGVRAAHAPLVAFLDDDVLVPPAWLGALARGAAEHPGAEAFGGPIRARLEGRPPRSCGREKPPVTTLDLGPADREAEMVWGANMALRTGAFARIGPFDESIHGHGDEEDWLLRLRAAGGRIEYLAAAEVEHRRAPSDATLVALSRAAYHRGRAARGSDERRGGPPPLRHEVRVLAGCAWHSVRYGCAQGPIMGAHAAGRLARAVEGTPGP